MRTLQMVTPEQDHIQELTKTNPFGQKQGIISSNHSFSSERGRTSRVKTKRKKARTRFNYKTNMKQAQHMHKHIGIQSQGDLIKKQHQSHPAAHSGS